jgi:predicted O-methyltransferase YrrM
MFLKHIYQQEQFGEDWFTYKQLYSDMVRKFPSGSTFVEIGSWKGKSAAYMAVEIANSQKNINFYCVDTWEGSTEHQNTDLKNLYNLFLTNMTPVKKYYNAIKLKSIDASFLFEDQSVDFVFIDGSHEYNNVKNDIKKWLPKIRKNGILAGHDYQICFSDVVRAVLECLPKYIVDAQQKCFIYYNE